MVDANLLLEDELVAARTALAQVEAQRDFLLERLVDLEGDVWEVQSEGEERPPALVSAKRKASASLVKNLKVSAFTCRISYFVNASCSQATLSRPPPSFLWHPNHPSVHEPLLPLPVQAPHRPLKVGLLQSLAVWLTSCFADRSGLCSATLKSGKLCRRKATTGFVYCGYHLPLDPGSGYMYCLHQKVGGRSCGNPVLKSGDGLCKYHKPDGGSAAAKDRGPELQFEDEFDEDDQ
jgi:hypothetical protein